MVQLWRICAVFFLFLACSLQSITQKSIEHRIGRNCGAFAPYFFIFPFLWLLANRSMQDGGGIQRATARVRALASPLLCMSGKGSPTIFSYLFFFTCIRGTGRDLMGRFFCSIGVQRCIASRFSATSQARLISYQILLLDYFPPSQAGTRPGSPSISISNTTTLIMFQALKRERGQVH